MPAQGQSLDSRRFLFVTGKGGVGKTTVCAALALAMAARGKRVLVTMTGVHERLSSILNTPAIGHDIQKLQDNLWASKIDAERAMEEYGQMVLGVKALARLVFDNKYTTAFFRAVPGLFEWAMLGKAWYHTTETLDDGSARFDVVLFDAPSTGHGLDMLRVPKVILDIVPSGILRRDAEVAWKLLQDPRRSGVVVVSQPEEMPTTETIELVAALEGELKLPVLKLVINNMHKPLFSPAEREALTAQEDLLDVGRVLEDPGDRALSFAARRAVREALQARCAAQLRDALSIDTTVLPFVVGGAGTPEAVLQLAALL